MPNPISTTEPPRQGWDKDPVGARPTIPIEANVQFTGSIGYATGAGGTVTQSTNKSTGVTLNTLSGHITLNNANLAAATIVSFTLTNSQIAATDLLILQHHSGGTPGSYTLNARAGSGSATIDIRNNTAGGLAEAIVIAFAVIKGATS